MSDPITLTSVSLASLSHLSNLVKTLFDARDRTINLEQVNALLSEINTVQTGYLALLQQNTALVAEKDELKKQITCFETWEAEKQRYELKDVGPEVFAYVLKETSRGSEPIHWLCRKCYQESKKGILGLLEESDYQKKYECPICKATLHVKNPNYKDPKDCALPFVVRRGY